MVNYVRPRIDYIYLAQIRCAYPKETSKIKTIEDLVIFAIKKAIVEAKKDEGER